MAQDRTAVAADDYEAEALLGGILHDRDFRVGDVDFFAVDFTGLSRSLKMIH